MTSFVKLTDASTAGEVWINPALVAVLRPSGQGTRLHLLGTADANVDVLVREPIGQVVAALAG